MTLRLLERALGDPPVRLAYEIVSPARSRASLMRFLETAEAKLLAISPEEIHDLTGCVWFGEKEEPSHAAWHDFVLLRRRVRQGE